MLRPGQTRFDAFRSIFPAGTVSGAPKVRAMELIAELEKELKAAGADIAAFEYVRRTREISRMTVPSALGGTSTPVLGGNTPGGELFRGFGALSSKVSTLALGLMTA